MPKKNKKTKNTRFSITEEGLIKMLYVFLLAISFTYGALIWGIGESAKNEKILETVSVNRYSQRENKIKDSVKGYPISEMATHISRQNPQTAAFLLGIAKKESNWGKFSPKKNGKECYNYWGYRGTYNQTQSGYSCFDSPRQAVKVVGARLEDLISQKLDTPRKLVIWKCGSDQSCAETPQAEKWIADVSYYYQKF